MRGSPWIDWRSETGPHGALYYRSLVWGSSEEVVGDFRSIRCSNGRPDQFGLAVVLSACARLDALNYGRAVHCDVVKDGFGSSSFCEGALVDMYSKCDRIADARKVFDGITHPDTISWTNMIAGYVRVAMCSEALELFFRMEKNGGVPDQVTYVTVISACVSSGKLDDAKSLFTRMNSPNTVAYNAIISGYTQNGLEDDALGFYKEMRRKGLRPTRSTLGSVLSAAANLTALDGGRQIHSEAIRFGLDSNVYVGSALINMYAKCSLIGDARKLFYFLDDKNIVTWNAMLNGLVQNERPEQAIELFLGMRQLGVETDEFTLVSLFGSCASLESSDFGRQLHCAVIKSNLGSNLYIGNAVLDMYAKCGELNDAKAQFELIQNKDGVSWNAFIVGLVRNEEEEEALRMFKKMRLDAVAPDEVSLASVISACSNLQAIEAGKQIQCLSIKFSLSSNQFVGSSLIDFYSKLGEMGAAEKVYQRMHERSVVTMNALTAGYVQNNNQSAAFNVFRQIQANELDPSSVTFASILPACTGPFGSIMGKQVHCRTLKSGLLYNDTFLGVSLLGMYLKSKMIEDANELFAEMPHTNSLVLWTAIISGHAQNGCSDEALSLFWKMRSCNVRSDEAAFASVLGACADLASITDGKEVHSLIIKSGFASYGTASSALVDMYSKCGDVHSSFKVFENMENKEDIISWNSMIVGLAKNGYAPEALTMFQKMRESNIEPDDVTFLGVLTACAHAGLVTEGRHFFDSMTEIYRIAPRLDHYACMVDLLSRVGHLKEAQDFIEGSPFEPDSVIWATFLAACRTHNDEIRGKIAAEKLAELEPTNSSTYILLSNLYASSGNWSGAKMVREAMRERGVRKSPGCSWITVGNKTSLFLAGDKFHPDSVIIYEILSDLIGVMKQHEHVNELLLLDEGLG
ncbi:Pentatricopeptide repeat-containing protein, mitochondrial [Ananas comosus]|uniref:Pentatricopeptide repeat-containing protein, mitochondrial n=1 Tax=Ananas comosus TaxID=4615 RepID=A0A199W9D8_ANACO|nr:Pentatricopeptide repeat-containing protein, mitochondrial [Ananas comosus]